MKTSSTFEKNVINPRNGVVKSNRFTIIVLAIAMALALIPLFTSAQSTCSFGETAVQLYRSYSINTTDNGNVINPDNVLGYPDHFFSRVIRGNIPIQRGRLSVELLDLVPQGDTIYFSVASSGNQSGNYSVASSSNGVGGYTAATNYTSPANGFAEDFYVVTDPAGAKWIRFRTIDNGRHLDVEYVYFRKYECYSNCGDVNISYTYGTADAYQPTVFGDIAAHNGFYALGAPNLTGAEVYLTAPFGVLLNGDLKLDLTETIPYGAFVQLYIKRGVNNTQFEVRSSLTGTAPSFGDPQGYLADQDEYVPYIYEVTNPTGIRYVMIESIQLNRSVLVDAVDYLIPSVYGKKIISGNVFNDANQNGTLNFGETGTNGITVALYEDVNGDGLLNAGDQLIHLEATDNAGDYVFETNSLADNFIVGIDQITLAATATMTTAPEVAISFSDLNQSECVNFGYYDCGNNCNPEAFDDQITTDINTPVDIEVLLNDRGAIDPSSVTTSGVMQPTGGSVSIDGNGLMTYSPNPNFLGVDSFQYVVCNNGPSPVCDTAFVVVTVVCPIVANQNTISGSIFTDYNTNNNFDSYEVWNLGGQMTINLHIDVNGDATIDGLDVVIATTQTDASGNYSFVLPNNAETYIVAIDPSTGPPSSAVTGNVEHPITFTGGNQAFCAMDFGITFCSPYCWLNAVDDVAEVASGSALFINVVENDIDYDNNIDYSSLYISSQPLNGSVVIGENGQIIYVPNGSFVGTDQFQYHICDETFPTPQCDAAWVYITVNNGYGDPCAEATKEHIFYLPYPENELRPALIHAASSSCGAWINDIARSITTIKSPYPGVEITYDQWEDGYESNILIPSQSTTQVWGDRDVSNGVAPGYPDDYIPAGGNIVLDNQMIFNPRNPADIVFDGKDKLHTSGDVAISKIAGDIGQLSIQAAKTDVYDINRFGTNFTVPFGEDLGNEFQYTALYARVANDSTLISIDMNNNGFEDTSIVLNEGEVFFIDGGIQTGAIISSKKPIGVDVLFGGLDCYGTRQVNLLPASFYANVYYTPVPTTDASAPAAVYLNNSLEYTWMTVNWYSLYNSGTISIPADSFVRFELTDNSGYKFINHSGQSFTAIEVVDSDNNGQNYDWSFNLISGPRLTNFASIAWAPGSIDGSGNYNPLWVTPTGSTTIYIKYDGDITTPTAQMSPCGIPYDDSISLDELEYHRIFDNSDNDQSGIAIYTCDGTTIAAVYGEDPSAGGPTPIASPGWDVGTSIQPMCLDKLILANDDCINAVPNDYVVFDVTLNDHAFLTTLDPTSVSTNGLLQPSHGVLQNNGDGTFNYTPFPGWQGIDTFQYSVCSTEYPDLCDIAYVFLKVVLCDANPYENNVNGYVYLEQLADDGVYTNETRKAGFLVHLYGDTDCDSIIDSTELIIETAITDANGAYSFHTINGEFVKDNFEDTIDVSGGNNGSVAWDNNWQEIGETDGFATGSIKIDADASFFDNALYVGGSQNGVSRNVTFADATGASIKFNLRRLNLTDNGGELTILVNGNLLQTISDGNGVNTDPYYIPFNIGIPYPFINPNGVNVIEIGTNAQVGSTSAYLIDEFEVIFNTNQVCFITQVDVSNQNQAYLPSSLHQTSALFDATLGNCVPDLYLGVLANILAIDNYSIGETDNPQHIDILANDFGNVDITSVSTTGLDQPNNGSTVIESNGSITYYPNPGFEGLDTFEYAICNIEDPNVCDTATVFITVSCFIVPNGNSLAGSIYNDLDGDGTRDIGEGLYPNIDVILFEDNNGNGILDGAEAANPIDTITAVDGNYRFTVSPSSFVSAYASARVNASSDDAEEDFYTDSMYLNSSDIELTNDVDERDNQRVGLRFNLINIPQGAQIENAFINFTVDETDSSPTSVTIYGEDEDNAVTFTSTAGNISSRTKTDSSVNWNNIPSWSTVGSTQTTPDIASIIQEIVNRPNWINLNSIVIIIEGTGTRTAEAFDGVAANAPELEIAYRIYNYPASYIAMTDVTTHPVGTFLTTDNIETSTFTFLSQSDCINDFGLATNNTVAIDDINATLKDIPVTGSVMRNDFDVEGDNSVFSYYFNQADNKTPITSGTLLSGTDIGGGYVYDAGVLSFDANGEYNFTPSSTFNGEVVIKYMKCDDALNSVCDTATLTIIVGPFPNPNIPGTNNTVISDDYKAGYESNISGNVLVNDSDVEEDLIYLSNFKYDNLGNGTINQNGNFGTTVLVGGKNKFGEAVDQAGHFTLYSNGDYTFQPYNNFIGTVKIVYSACDDFEEPYKACEKAFLTIEVIGSRIGATNDAPFAGDDLITTIVNKPVSGWWIKNDGDSNDDLIQYMGNGQQIDPNDIEGKSVVATYSSLKGGQVIVYTDGSYTYQPPLDYYGPDQLAYQICDVDAAVTCDSATIYFLAAPLYVDYGDLPAQFPVAGNVIAIDFDGDVKPDLEASTWFGELVDYELATQETNSAQGDNENGANDEDGLIFPTNANLGSTVDFEVVINGIDSNLVVYYGLWFDWDFDGVFDDFYNGYGVTPGSGSRASSSLLVSVSIPANVPNENVGIRLRAFQSLPNASQFGGNRRAGEVEDYIMYVLSGSTLPVELAFFTAESKGNDAILNWSTASEINNDYFSVQRSTDAINWEEIGIVEGYGTTTEVQNYNYNDNDLANGTYYYRLEQFDYDGSSEYSNVESVTIEGNDEVELSKISVFPNPVHTHGQISIRGVENKKVNLRIFGVDGSEKVITLNNTSRIIDMTKFNLSAGTYILQIEDGEKIHNDKIVVYE